MTDTQAVHALSFDIEDWFHILGVPELEDRTTWADRPSIVEPYTHSILEMCADAGVHATFFVLGWVAERYPGLVAEIASAGHELGTHSHEHRLVTDQTPAEFSADLARSIAAVEDAGGVPVTGYRAPSFSIRPGTEWAFERLLEAGIEYDASLYPARRMNGGYAVSPRPHRFEFAAGETIPALPMSVLGLGSLATGYSGGGYLRLFPLPIIRWGIRRGEARGLPTVVYLHPRDIAPDAPRARMPAHRRFMTYVGLSGTRAKLEALLTDYRWATCREVLDAHLEGE